ncbi:protease complex subunit PrcB family protein [Saccharophagus sp. K07]|uniref:protease complex subunit PrcB family protein n=1 Tax=Saccharophagus sp. K07 TaxID=2283636 RepID=UPI00165244BB|nr:protease complex subunit PrcB family protein [Saccharophagus sp. K07]MBC6904853.1 protease complex subunit PrcB family protein [Saccharophagus sp. K07]
MKKPLSSFALSSALLMGISACSTSTNGTISVRSVFQGQQCSYEKAGLYAIDHNLLAALSGGGGKLANRWEEETAPQISTDERLILVSLGQKPSGGHSLSLAGEAAKVADGVVTLPLSAQQPVPGSMQTMQLTYPCLIIALPTRGYTSVRSDLFPDVLTIDQ